MTYDPKLVDALEADQLVARTSQPYSRRALDRGTLTLLLTLRIYVMIAVPIVIYAFVHALVAPQ